MEPERYRFPCPVEGTEASPLSPGWVQPYCDSPLDRHQVAENAYLQLISRATRYIWLTSPYLILDNRFLRTLCAAAQSGVQVRVLCPRQGDRWFVHMVTRSYYPPLLAAGVEVWEYSPGFIHAKNFVVDDRFATVGTVNLDYRSLFLHFEDGIWLCEAPCIRDIRRDFEETQAKSEAISLRRFKHLNIILQLYRSILRVFAPLM